MRVGAGWYAAPVCTTEDEPWVQILQREMLAAYKGGIAAGRKDL